MKFNKKGAIELSITGVIVLIIAITVLGLVLNFVREYFIKAGDPIKDAFEQLQQDVINKLKTGGDLAFSGGDILKVKGGAKTEALGIRNTLGEDYVCHRVEFICKRPYAGVETWCDKTIVGGRSTDGTAPASNWFETQDDWEIKSKKVEVKEVDVKLEEVKSGKYSMQLNVYREINGKDCDSPDFGPADAKPWKDHTFTLDVSAE
ncbi:hypothetical protein COV11_02580 [Candidatus Woesearchaeota archaeon CG10_big_fil_rev_8_21_14_0_10_30_7]|nr:MAG: hypothetical protein COV11_02580 [Candidatus Woesearchaeota archaeon CG10_big_fil_rev_8_21_14_0_10_30_7]